MTKINDRESDLYPKVYYRRNINYQDNDLDTYAKVTVYFASCWAAWPMVISRIPGNPVCGLMWRAWDTPEGRSVYADFSDVLSYEDGLQLLYRWLIVERRGALPQATHPAVQQELKKVMRLCLEMFGQPNPPVTLAFGEI